MKNSFTKKWMPQRIDIKTFDGDTSVLNVGKDAIVTVQIKGPYVDLTYTDVQALVVYPK